MPAKVYDQPMRILLVGAGGVGTAFARIAARRRFAELVIADYDLDWTPGTNERPRSCSPSAAAMCS